MIRGARTTQGMAVQTDACLHPTVWAPHPPRCVRCGHALWFINGKWWCSHCGREEA